MGCICLTWESLWDNEGENFTIYSAKSPRIFRHAWIAHLLCLACVECKVVQFTTPCRIGASI